MAQCNVMYLSCVCLSGFISSGAGRIDMLVVTQPSLASPVVTGTCESPDRKNAQVVDGQIRQTNIDVNKPTEQSPQQQKLLMSSPKSMKPQRSNQPPLDSMETNTSPQKQGNCSEPANLSASHKTAVTSESSKQETHHTSSGVIVGM